MLPYELTSRAALDLEHIRERYTLIREDLGHAFAVDFVETMRRVRERPTSFPTADEGARVARLRSFRYRVYFDVDDDMIRVFAVYHTSRNPERWNDPNRD